MLMVQRELLVPGKVFSLGDAVTICGVWNNLIRERPGVPDFLHIKAPPKEVQIEGLPTRFRPLSLGWEVDTDAMLLDCDMSLAPVANAKCDCIEFYISVCGEPDCEDDDSDYYPEFTPTWITCRAVDGTIVKITLSDSDETGVWLMIETPPDWEIQSQQTY